MTAEGTTSVVASGMPQKRDYYQSRGSVNYGINVDETRESTQRKVNLAGKKEFWSQEQPNDPTILWMMTNFITS